MNQLISAFVNGALLGIAVVMAVWLVLRLIPRSVLNAATRYAIWWATLGVVLVLPVAYLPIHVTAPVVAQAPIEVTASPDVTVTESAAAVPVSDPEPYAAPVTAAAASPSTKFPLEIPGGRWPQRIFLAWVVCALAMLGRLAVSYLLLEHRKRHAFAPPAPMAGRMAAWLAICGTRRAIRLAASSEIATPMAAGPRHPSILIPAALFGELDAPELDQIGLHETAHLARRDDYAVIIQRVIEALFVLHPAVRWITRRIDLEREIACDDFVVEATGRARNYAICLTRVVELSGGVRGSLAAAAATEERSHLAQRVEMLLDKSRHTGTRLLKARMVLILSAVVALALVAARTPGLVAFAMPLEITGQPEAAQIPDPPQTPPVAPARRLAGEIPQPPPPPPGSALERLEMPLPPEPPLDLDAPAPPAPPPPARGPFAGFAPFAPAPPPAMGPAPAAPPVPRPMAAFASPPQTPPAPAMAPAPPAPPAPPQQDHFIGHFDVNNGVNEVDWHWRDGLSTRDLRMHGTIEFTEDESDIKSISSGGWFSYEESHGFSDRRYQVLGDGPMTRRYTVDGREHAIDDEARAWLRASLPEILRESGIDAGSRVRRILRQGGANAVLAEIQKIRNNGARRRYVQELVPIGNLTADHYQTLLRLARAMNSDGEKAQMLIFLSQYTMKENLRDYMFDAVSTINSAGERRRVLSHLIEADRSQATLAGVAKSSAGITSDGEKAVLLVELARRARGNDEMRRPFFRAVETINSAGERARVLVAALEGGASHRDFLLDALRATTGITSDGEKARVLVSATNYWLEDDAVRRAFFDATNTVNSAGEHARILATLTSRSGVGVASMLEIVRSADRIPADGEKTRILSMVVERPDASSDVLVAAVQSAARINSEGEKARILVQAIPRSSGKPAVRTEIRNAVKTLHSDSEYRRVMTALERQMVI